MRLFTFFHSAALIICILLLVGSGLAQEEESALVSKAESAQEDGRLAEAWRAILQIDLADGTAWQKHQDLIFQVISEMSAALNTATEQRDFERVVELGELLRRAESAALIQKVYPQHVEQYGRVVRRHLGNAYIQLAQGDFVGGRASRAEMRYRRAVEILEPVDPDYARANLLLGQFLYEYGRPFFTDQRDRTKALWTEAVSFFVIARDHAAEGSDVAQQVSDMLAMLGAVEITRNLPGVITPTPSPTPTPAEPPGFLETGLPAEVMAYLSGLANDSSVRGRIIFYGAIAVGFFVIYWVLPFYVLGLFEKRGDIAAAIWGQKIKFLGVFAIFGYAVSLVRRKREKKVSRKEHGCPHCGEPLDNMFQYDDMVFSRCPHCKNKIVPLFTLEQFVETLANSMATDVEKVNVGTLSLDSFVKRDAMVRLVRAAVTLGVRRRASDVHVEPDENALIVRQRIDGVMTEMFHFPRSLSLAFVSAIKVSANMDISEKRIPQDGKFQMMIDKTNIDVRVATSPTNVGEKASLRILDVRSIQMGTKHLGMSGESQEMFDRAIHSPHGMVLITGPTGSGKTTTIYVALQQLTKGDKNIISIEDPIEFRIPGVNQTQINPTAGLTFASGLRSILRQDPDVIVVGEIRDKETAEISVNSVQTGHLVFSTLHTVDAASSVARLIDFEVSPRQFADALSLIVAQRLIRLVCQYCKKPYHPDEGVLRELGLKPPLDDFNFQRGTGCETCNNTGHYRRTGIFEMLRPSERMRVELENASLSTGQIRELAVQGGMRTLRQEAILLLKEGRTSAEETLRVTK